MKVQPLSLTGFETAMDMPETCPVHVLALLLHPRRWVYASHAYVRTHMGAPSVLELTIKAASWTELRPASHCAGQDGVKLGVAGLFHKDFVVKLV